MKQLSQAYREATKGNIIQAVDYDMQITLGIIDYDATNKAKVDTSDGMTDYEPSCADTKENGDTFIEIINKSSADVKTKYASFEQDAFILEPYTRTSNSLALYDDADDSVTLYQGYVSNAVCDANGKFKDGTAPKLIINIDGEKPCDIYGLTFYFDHISDIYAKRMRITTTMQDDTTRSAEVENDGYVVFEYIPTPDADGTTPLNSFKSLCVEFLELNKPNCRVRLFDISLGVLRVFSSADMVDTFTHSVDLDVTSRRLPQQKMSFSVRSNEMFEPDSANNVTRYLEEEQPVTATLTVRYNNGEPDEKVKLCDMLLVGDYSGDGTKVTFNAISYLQNANDKFNFEKFTKASGNGPHTFKQLLTGNGGIFSQMNLSKTADNLDRWVLDDCLDNYSVPVGFDPGDLTLKECVQLIAMAACCVLYEDCDGKIHIEPMPETQGIDYSYDRMFSEPVLTRYPALKAVEVYWYETKDTDKTNDLGEQIYTWEKSNETLSFSTGTSSGETEEIDNIFISADAQAIAVSEFITCQLKKRNEYKVEVIGGLETDALDVGILETKYDKEVSSMIIEKSLKYNGSVNTDLVFVMDK